jgi:hypothetical protein
MHNNMVRVWRQIPVPYLLLGLVRWLVVVYLLY